MKYDFTKVQQRMEAKGLTLRELADMIAPVDEIHVSTISKALKRGTASQRTAKAISRVLRIPLTEMLRKTA